MDYAFQKLLIEPTRTLCFGLSLNRSRAEEPPCQV
jgi:hypothetical protein